MVGTEQLEHDEALEALVALSEATASSIDALCEANEKLAAVRHQRCRGLSWRRIGSSTQFAEALSSVARISANLARASGQFRRSVTKVLHSEGLRVTEIGQLLEVSRQRVSALLRPKSK